MTIELLIVEDDKKHLRDAKAEVKRQIEEGAQIKAYYAKNLKEAQEYLNGQAIDVVISDVFFPSGMEKKEESRIIKHLSTLLRKAFGEFTSEFDKEKERAIQEWECGRELAPLGVYIAENYKGPLVFCTSTYHHGARTEPVNVYVCKKEKIGRKIGIVDDLDAGNGEAKKKKWDLALSRALSMLDQNNKFYNNEKPNNQKR